MFSFIFLSHIDISVKILRKIGEFQKNSTFSFVFLSHTGLSVKIFLRNVLLLSQFDVIWITLRKITSFQLFFCQNLTFLSKFKDK